MSALSFWEPRPANAIAFPGANFEGAVSHLSRLPSVHLSVALLCSAFEYAKPSAAAMLVPGRPPRAGPTE